MTQREFDVLTKRNNGERMIAAERNAYAVDRCRGSGFDLLDVRERRCRVFEQGAIPLIERHVMGRAHFRALKAAGRSDGGLFA